MGKKRVYELARELGIPSKSFIERAQALGYSWIQSHANTLEGNEATELASKLSQGGGQTQTKKRSTVLRRRAVRATSTDNGADSGYEVVTTRLSDTGAEVIERKQIEMSVPGSFIPSMEAPSAPSIQEDTAVEVTTPEVSAPETAEPVVEAAPQPVVEESVAPPVEETPVVEAVVVEATVVEAKEAEPAKEIVEPAVVAEPVAPPAPVPPKQPERRVVENTKTPKFQNARVIKPPPTDGARVQNTSARARTQSPGKAQSIDRIGTDRKRGGDEWLPRAQAPASPGSSTDGPGRRGQTTGRTDGRGGDGRGGDGRGGSGRGGSGRGGSGGSGAGDRNSRGGGGGAGGANKGSGRKRRTGFDGGGGYGNRRGRQSAPGSRHTKQGKRRKKGEPVQTTTVPMRKEKRVVKIDGAIKVADLAHSMGIKAAELIGDLLRQGEMARINDVISVETAEQLAKSKGYEVKDTSVAVEDLLERDEEIVEDPDTLVSRPPVVTVMGHVDHGKTSLLDSIRETRVADGEAGGITQHIGASVVTLPDGRNIVFLDTPGHEAFTAMRSRGAQSTDIVILVVAADDSVMPQTIEAISHSQAAGVPIVVAVNKIDKAGADATKVRTDLMQYSLIPEDFGGDTQIVDVSAHTREGIPALLEAVLLQAEIMELSANPDRKAQGLVVESRIEKGRGAVSTVLVQAGTIRAGDAIVAGTEHGRIRAMFDHNNKPIKEAGPSMPVKILGLSGTPAPGDNFDCVEDERAARQVAEIREAGRKVPKTTSPVSLDDLWGASQKKELNVILKTDVEGTLEALKQSLLKLRNDEIQLSITHAAVGGITENDINLASTTGSVVLGFSIRADNKAQKLAESEGIEIRTYRVIYELLDDVRAAMERELAPTLQEKPIGQAEIRKTFNIPKAGKVAGCYVTEGKITRGSLIRLYREDRQIYEGKVQTLRRFKNDVKEVATGYECGIQIEGYQDIHEGDMIEAYEIEELVTKLEITP